VGYEPAAAVAARYLAMIPVPDGQPRWTEGPCGSVRLPWVGTLYTREIGDEVIHTVAGALMRLLIVLVISIEVITPDRHMSVSVIIIARLTVDDLIDLRRTELTMPPRGDERQIGRGNFEILIRKSVAARIRAVARGTIHGKQMIARLGIEWRGGGT
jgi:hypothetical protein